MIGPLSHLERISEALGPYGILVRGVVNFDAGEGPMLADGSRALSVVLLGNAGSSIWPAFSRWRKTYQGTDPLDTWSKQLIRPLAGKLGASAYFPSDPPWQPFQQWATKAEGLKPSPLGILIHPKYGLWHGYRGALGFSFEIEAAPAEASHPCDRCLEKPCLAACPADAVGIVGFDVMRCRTYLKRGSEGVSCMISGCLARSACPVGATYRYEPEQLRFHMQALF
ncbi:4Fe-4S dicluster domain-containing protein [Rhizobium terrae]|uniref:ferredoxin n=1 Tax=Rhizobium terrae TaxID=2171756 RepID=UPI001D025AE2|nr:ferredoxin [Rhizobium terrae]